jgi:putative FmdB family regulatory protein
LYEYQCPQCGRFELIQKFSDPPLTNCPTCSSTVEKLLSAPAIQFKGAGWYVTDYARKSAEGGAKSDAAKGDASKSDGGKSETPKSGDTATSSGASSAGGSGTSGSASSK